jgi:hypothetical protein
MAKLTISEALGWQKILATRYSELVTLRNQNSYEERRYLGANADKQVDRRPTYDVKELDKAIAKVAREQRLLDAAIKKANATLVVPDYEQDDSVLGEVQ